MCESASAPKKLPARDSSTIGINKASAAETRRSQAHSHVSAVNATRPTRNCTVSCGYFLVELETIPSIQLLEPSFKARVTHGISMILIRAVPQRKGWEEPLPESRRLGISNSHDASGVFQRRVTWMRPRLLAAGKPISRITEPDGYSGVCGSCRLG